MHGSPGWIRTSDTWINSPLRYHCATGESARNIVAEPRAFAKWCFLRTYNCMAAGYGRLRKVRVTGGMSRLRTQTSGFAHPGPQRVHKRTLGRREVRTVGTVRTNQSKTLPTVRTNESFVDPAGVPVGLKVDPVTAVHTFYVQNSVGAWSCRLKEGSVRGSTRTDARRCQSSAPTKLANRRFTNTA